MPRGLLGDLDRSFDEILELRIDPDLLRSMRETAKSLQSKCRPWPDGVSQRGFSCLT